MRGVLFGVAMAVLAGCGGGDAEAGGEIYTSTCAPCHGADGTAGVGGAPDLTVAIPARSDSQIETSVTEGVGTAMPPQAVTADEMPDLIAYLRETFGEES